MKISIKKLLFITISLFIINNLYSGTYDGYYNAQFAFKMSQKSYCPNELPVDIEIEVRDNKVIGYIFNQGHPNNSNRNCALYHNGDITGEIEVQKRKLFMIDHQMILILMIQINDVNKTMKMIQYFRK